MACVFGICKTSSIATGADDDGTDAAFPVAGESAADKARAFAEALQGLREVTGISAAAAEDGEVAPLREVLETAATAASGAVVMVGFVAAAAMLHTSYVAMGQLEEFSALLIDRLTAVLLLLQQRSIRDVIEDDAGTRKVLVQLLQLMDAIRVSIVNYTSRPGWAGGRLFGASSALAALKEQDDALTKAFQMLEQFVSLRTAAMLREHIAPEDRTVALQRRIASAVNAERAVQLAAVVDAAEDRAKLQRELEAMREEVLANMAEAFAKQGAEFREALEAVASSVDVRAEAINSKVDGLTAHQLLAAQQAEHAAAANEDMHRGTHRRLAELSNRVDMLSGGNHHQEATASVSTADAASVQHTSSGLPASSGGEANDDSAQHRETEARSSSAAAAVDVRTNAPMMRLGAVVPQPLTQQFDRVIKYRRAQGESQNTISAFLGYSGTNGGRDLGNVRSGRALKVALADAVLLLNTGSAREHPLTNAPCFAFARDDTPLAEQFNRVVSHRRHAGETYVTIAGFLGYDGPNPQTELHAIRAGESATASLYGAVSLLNEAEWPAEKLRTPPSNANDSGSASAEGEQTSFADALPSSLAAADDEGPL